MSSNNKKKAVERSKREQISKQNESSYNKRLSEWMNKYSPESPNYEFKDTEIKKSNNPVYGEVEYTPKNTYYGGFTPNNTNARGGSPSRLTTEDYRNAANAYIANRQQSYVPKLARNYNPNWRPQMNGSVEEAPQPRIYPEIEVDKNSAGYKKYGDKWTRALTLSAVSELNKDEKREAAEILKQLQSDYNVVDQTDVFFSPDMPSDMWKTYTDLYNKSNAGTGITAGFMDAFGASGLLDKGSELASGMLGEEYTPGSVKEQFSRIGSAHPNAYSAGNVAGSLASMLAAGEAAGAGLGAISGFGKLPKLLQGAIRSGATMGLSEALSGAANMPTRREWDISEANKKEFLASFPDGGIDYTPKDYSFLGQAGDVLRKTGIRTVGGFAGGLAGGAIGELGKAVLVKHELQTPFAEVMRQAVSGTAFSAADIGSTYFLLPEEERPNSTEMAQQVATAFLFSVLEGSISTISTTMQNKAKLENAVAQMQSEYSSMLNGKSPEEQIAALRNITELNKNIRSSISQNYYAGQQDAINDILQTLDAVDEAIGLIQRGITSGSSGSTPANATSPVSTSPSPAGNYPAPIGNSTAPTNSSEAAKQALAQAAARASQAQHPEDIRQAASQAAENAAQSPLKKHTSNNAAAPAKTAQNGVATRHTATTSNGNAVSVVSIVDTDNGLNVRLSDGTTAQLSNVDFDDPNINVLYERAASFDADTANALVNNYTGETSVDNYLRGFNSVYLSGKQGYEYAKAVGDSVYARHYLNDNARMAAFRAGQAAYQSARANSIAGQQGNNVRPQAKAEYKAGVNREYSDQKLTSSQRKQIRALDEVFKAAGKKLVIHDAIGTDGNSVTFGRSDANAYYDAKTDTYHLSLDSTGQAYAYVVAHESIHEMEVKNKEGFSALSEVVEAAIEGELMNQKGMTFDEAKAEFEKMVQYQIDKNGLSRSEAVTEVVANTVPVTLTDEQQGKRFADKVMKSGSKVKAWFEKLIKDLRAILDKAYNILKGQKSWEQMELIRNNKQTLDMIADYYFEGMEGTKGKASNTEKTDGNVKRSAKDISADIREINPMEITPLNRVTSSSKYHYLINEFENNGYNGRNVVLVENGNDGYQALTGSHRILAAREAGVDVPSVVIPMSEEIQPLLDATGDEERARIADELYEDGIIPKEARDLLVREDELNFENLGKPLDKQVRFSEKDTEQKAVSTFGTTYSWNETGYLTPSGKQLDFSGKRDGAQAGYRSMDHRDVSELYDAEGVGGTDAMIKFMNEGNIRISPEMGGINLQSMPTKAQFDKLQSFVRKNGGEVTIDFDDANGNTLHSIEYPQGTGPVRINNDIKRYYNEGKVPEISETQRFSFSRKDDVSVTPEDAKKLQKQNDKLQQALEVAKQEIKLSDGHHVKASAVERLAGSLLREYSSKMDKAELVSNITELFDYIGNGENVVWDEVQAGAMNIALNVLDQSSKRNTEWYDNTKPAREFLKNNTIKLNEKQLAEVQNAFGSYTEFRRGLYNKAKFSKTDGISLEQAWRDLSGMFPDTFGPDTPDVDMPTLLHDEVLNMYDRPIENPYGYGMKEYAADLAMRLYGEYMALPERKTFADKQQKKLEMQRARYNTLMEQQREQAKAKYEKLRDQRDITKYKTSIEKNAKSLYSWLTKPNNSKHVPEALRNKTADLLKTLEFDGKKGYMWKDAMRNLQTWMQQVDRAKTNPDIDNPLIEYAPDLIDNMQSLLDGASKYNNISDMPLDKLKELNNIVAAVKHTVTTANTVIADGRRQYIDDIGGNIIKAAQVQRPKVREFMRKHPYAYKMASAVSGFFNSGNVKPIYFFDNIGGEMKTLFNDVRQASYKAALLANTIRGEYAQIKDKHHYKEWADKNGDLLTIQTKGGSNVSITREQALDIYATAKREKLIGTQHLTKDGFVFNKDVVQKNGKLIETATNDNVNKPLSEETITEISDWLTKEQKGYADALVELMSTKGAELGNEVTMLMYGINRFAESYYIPIMSAHQFIDTAFNGRVSDAMSWMNKGFTKNTVAGAGNPIVITGITQKALQHMADMATYNAMAIPQDTMAKVYNYKQRGEDGGPNTYIRAELDKAYGQHTSKYIKTFINDISGNITVDPRDSMASKMISTFRRNAVSGKLSVAIQQPSAIVRATALVDPKYFFGHVDKNTYDTAKKYSGTAVIKEVGGFDAYTGKGLVQWMADNDKFNFRNARDAVAGWLPQKMDEITWCRIWKACENEVADTTALERGSEDFYKAVGHRFDDVIEYTQVYDSVISRSEYMRSKSAGAKLFTSFKAEPTVSYNMYWYALKHMNEKGGKARLLRTAAFVIGAGVFNAMLKSVITAIRDDDENQNYVDKYVEALASNLVGTPLKKVPYIGEYIYLGGELDTLGSLPLVNEVLSMLQGYTSSRSELKVIQDLINAAGDLDNENKGLDERLLRMAKATSQMFGIPLDAFIKDWLGVIKESYKAISGNEPEFSGNIMYEIREGLGVKQELELYKGVDKAITTGDYTRLEKQFKTMVLRSTADDPMKNARETVRDAVRQYFDAHEVNAGNAKRILVKCGYGMDDAENLIVKWDFWRDFPVDHDKSIENNTEKLAAKYFELAEPVGVDKAVFYDIYKFNGAASADKDKNGKSIQNSKRDKVADYINKQSLTKAQKDAMYLACGYAKSSLDEAPWR